MRSILPKVFTLVLVSFAFSSAEAGQLLPYLDSGLDIETRVDDLLSRMTLHEKVLQLQNRQTGDPSDFDSRFEGYGIGTVHDMDHHAARCREITDSLDIYMSRTRFGIPALTCVEGIQGILQDSCTIFPHALAQGSTFNPALIATMTAACAAEAKALGMRQVLSPVLDIARELRWGRVEETFGEDPFLIAETATAFVDGYQSNGVACMPKHFVAHGTPTGGLNCANVCGGERELRNLYLYPFAKVISNAAPMAIMSCYSAYDGVPVSGSRRFMTDILRGELGFDGYVYSDWGSVDRLKTFHHAVATSEEAARQSLIAGIDVDVDDAYRTLEQQVTDGIIEVADIDNAVRRVLCTKFRLGLFDGDAAATKLPLDTVRCRSHVALAKAVADESAILLENHGLLPLDPTKLKSVAVVGPNAGMAVMGDYSWARPDRNEGVSLVDGLRAVLPENVTVNYAEGCDWWSRDTSMIAEAVEAARKSDVVIAAVGTRSTFLGRGPKNSTSGEAFDLSSLELPGVQARLLEALKATGKPLVVALIAGKPLALPWVKENADAFIVQWYGGEQQGQALAEIITGKVNPSGRLNVSFPRSTGNAPCYYNYYPTDREYGNDRGGTPDSPAMHYIFESPYALWPFGAGKGYTDFEYSDFKVAATDSIVTATLKVTNTGGREGKEVVQLYVSDPVSSILTPVRQLKAFSKVGIAAGEQTVVTLQVPVEELMFSVDGGAKVLEHGDFIIAVGRSSDDIRFSETITL
ncbi:MAG: glycoside hydrolase family 3 C-terminal domain-containing protein [Duncaniella sp.]|nr:glycoside hydrolase family 3 C-terminal domain-containing protein [Duncaniella sp.]